MKTPDDFQPRLRDIILTYHNMILKALTFVLYIAFVLLGLMQILMRYVFNLPVHWAEQVSRYMFAWSIFLGAALVVGIGTHIALDFLKARLPQKVQEHISVVIGIASIVLVAWLFVYDGFRLLPLVNNQFSPGVGIRMSVPYASVPVGGSLMLLNMLLILFGARDYRSERMQ